MAERVILGSASPRRAELLRQAGVEFEVRSCELDEAALVAQGDPVGSARRIALAKYDLLRELNRVAPGERLLTADTLVCAAGRVLGKPTNTDDAVSMLRLFSGQWSSVVTAMCFGAGETAPKLVHLETRVRLRLLSEQDLAGYVESGEGQDKAGGIALQGRARGFIDEIDGCWSNVIGLPLCVAIELLDGTAASDASRECSPTLCGSWRQHKPD